MTDARPKRRLPALGARILTFGLSFAGTVAMIGGFEAASRAMTAQAAKPAIPPPAAAPPPQQIIVRVIQRPAPVRRVSAPVRVVHRYHYVRTYYGGGGGGGGGSRVVHTASHGS